MYLSNNMNVTDFIEISIQKMRLWHYFGYNHQYMNKIRTIHFLFLSAALTLLTQVNEVQAQTTQSMPDVIENIRVSIKMANSKELTTLMSDMVEIQLPDQERNNYSKTQAEFVMRDFMKKYPPVNFTYIHKVLDKDDFKFTIGEYAYAGGTMRVTMVLKPVNSRFLIDSIIIERK
jgi:hypothetical protein